MGNSKRGRYVTSLIRSAVNRVMWRKLPFGLHDYVNVDPDKWAISDMTLSLMIAT